jgi:hypothetical protein
VTLGKLISLLRLKREKEIPNPWNFGVLQVLRRVAKITGVETISRAVLAAGFVYIGLISAVIGKVKSARSSISG